MKRALAYVVSLGILSALIPSSCGRPNTRAETGPDPSRLFPPPPQRTRVVALGNLRTSPAPDPVKGRLVRFLLGVEPADPLGLIRPTDLAMDGGRVLVCDTALSGLFTIDPARGAIEPITLRDPLNLPVAITQLSDGDRLVCDAAAGAVLRYDRLGKLRTRYRGPDDNFRPADAIQVGDALWVADALGHRIVVFDAATAAVRHTIGRRGSGPAEFGMPRALAAAPDGNIYVVDVLNARVQVLDPAGRRLRSIGRPGDRVGCFGRPRDVAVGPDGTVFVLDAASQRVHAFDAAGRPLLAFGGPGTGDDALSMPGGICVTETIPVEPGDLPAGFQSDYFILVTEQLLRPGIRAFAWGHGRAVNASAHAAGSPTNIDNPHWSPGRCGLCHGDDAAGPGPINRVAADELCLSCHDGEKAVAEAHPIARTPNPDTTRIPDGWPLADGRLGCLTCHDIRRHCDAAAVRPAVNPVMLRYHAPDRPLDFCNQCHQSDETWRINPHRHVAADGSPRLDLCAYCHAPTPAAPYDGKRKQASTLRAEPARLCLSCHARHWDYFPEGHVDRPMTQAYTANLLRWEAHRTGRPASAPPASIDRPTLLPTPHGNVTCISCHNPHDPSLFPANSELAVFSTAPEDRAVALRLNRSELCLVCHPK